MVFVSSWCEGVGKGSWIIIFICGLGFLLG